MTHTRTSRTLAATGVTAALLCAAPAAGHTVAAHSCDRVPNGQNFIDWARARSGQNHPALPDRQRRPLRTLLYAVDGPPEGQSFIDWARAQSSHTGQTQSARPIRRAQPLHSLLSTAATDGKR
jgi:hypothetical protein